jgi:ABC-type transport system substrate-binding protein
MLCAVLSGCGGGSEEQPKGEATSTRAQSNEIAVGIALDLDSSLDPHIVVAAGTKEVMFNVFEGLVKPTSNGDLIPAVAESYTVSDDRLTYTFTLREGVKFHNGDEVTAEDVIDSISRCRDAADAGVQQVAAFANIAYMTASEDGRTVEICVTEATNEFLASLTCAILPSDYTEQDTKPVGTGPFKFVSRSAQESIVMEKNGAYWGTPAKLDKVTFKIFENADSIIMSLQSGAVDLFSHLTSTQTSQLGEEFYVVEGAMNLVQALYLNHAEKPFDDPRVCEALCWAIDRQQIFDLAFDGYGFPIGQTARFRICIYFHKWDRKDRCHACRLNVIQVQPDQAVTARHIGIPVFHDVASGVRCDHVRQAFFRIIVLVLCNCPGDQVVAIHHKNTGVAHQEDIPGICTQHIIAAVGIQLRRIIGQQLRHTVFQDAQGTACNQPETMALVIALDAHDDAVV